ncbi:MAG TPA: hypothetical protein VIG24_01935 [Acidimicrobiia bacterium]
MMDRWRHRRRLVYFTVGFASAMVLVGALDWTDRQVSSQLVIGGVSLITLILTGYVFAATYDDRWSNYRGPSDFPPPHDHPDGHGMAP